MSFSFSNKNLCTSLDRIAPSKGSHPVRKPGVLRCWKPSSGPSYGGAGRNSRDGDSLTLSWSSSPDRDDWDGYEELISMVNKFGLKVQALMSFHQCSGNLGESCL